MNSALEKSEAWKRFKKSGLGLEDLQTKTTRLWDSYRKFTQESGLWVDRFKALNDTVSTLQSVQGLSPIDIEKRNAIIFKIGDLQLEGQDEYSKIVTECPAWFNDIYDVTEVFKLSAVVVQNMYSDTAACVPAIEKAERALAKAEVLYDKLEKRLVGLQAILKEQQGLYYQVVTVSR